MRPFSFSSETAGPDTQRRALLAAAAGLAVSAIAPVAGAAPVPPIAGANPQSLRRYARMFGGRDGEDVLWWFTEDLYLHTPGESLVPLCRPMTVGVVRGVGGTDTEYSYDYREAGVPLDLETGEPMVRNPLTGAPMKTPLSPATSSLVQWKLRPDGVVEKKTGDRVWTSYQRWTTTSDNVLLLETEPGPDAFGLSSADAAADREAAVHSTHTISAKRKDLDGDGFAPAQWVYNITTRTAPDWLGFTDGRDRRLLVRGLGIKSRKDEILNADTLAWVRKYFPGYL